jgi:hypothetical protein
MNCWEILGIEPTGDRERIKHAYEQQMKFASKEDAARIEQALNEAIATDVPARPLDGHEGQVVREVVIQVKALLHSSVRSSDVNIWRAILAEPPADQPLLKQEIARQLEPQLRPMAENGSFPGPVMQFLGEWFGWDTLTTAQESSLADAEGPDADDRFQDESNQPPQMVNFWPAVIGWVIGLVILASLFGGMSGS